PLLAMLFGMGSLAFLAAFVTSPRENWWAIIPSLVLAALGLLIGFPVLGDAVGGGIFLGMLALSFLIIFIISPREHWWAIIPGGVLLTLAIVSMISEDRSGGSLTGGVFFIGIGLTFALVFLAARQRWALW